MVFGPYMDIKKRGKMQNGKREAKVCFRSKYIMMGEKKTISFRFKI
jgi:hypothetical protein